MTFAQHFSAYSSWRAQLLTSIEQLRHWLFGHELSDAQTESFLQSPLEKLRGDRLRIAFVAEFSRGKSELINAIFFAHYGVRILPSSAGRTTMCPTELMFDATQAPCIRLLPIQTRASRDNVSDYKNDWQQWLTIPLETESAVAMQRAMQQVSRVLRVPPKVAQSLGFSLAQDGEKGAALLDLAADGLVEIPHWRHALINFPHPLLQQGLVILDTPGLNAIGTEPELTLSLLPSAHAVLFIVAADSGVTQSELEVWREYLAPGVEKTKGRMLVLNKIDGLWDDLKTEEELASEVHKQVVHCARILNLAEAQVFPVSAQKGLVAKIQADTRLLEKSRLLDLEAALAESLLPAQYEIVAASTRRDFDQLCVYLQGVLTTRRASLAEQLAELAALRGKNKGVVGYMLSKVHADKAAFEEGLKEFYAVRSVFSTLSNRLLAVLALDALRVLTEATRSTMAQAAFSKTLASAMRDFFLQVRASVSNAETEAAEIAQMVTAVHRKFVVEHAMNLDAPTPFSITAHRREIERLEIWCARHLNNPLQLAARQKDVLTERFFDEVGSQMRRIFKALNRDAALWLKALMSPLEKQIREHQLSLKQRMGNVKRIHEATSSLDERIGEVSAMEQTLQQQIASFETHKARVLQAVAAPLREKVVLRNVA
ncbi:MAG: dynamin family protein [Pseudomonadota bacterium]